MIKPLQKVDVYLVELGSVLVNVIQSLLELLLFTAR